MKTVFKLTLLLFASAALAGQLQPIQLPEPTGDASAEAPAASAASPMQAVPAAQPLSNTAAPVVAAPAPAETAAASATEASPAAADVTTTATTATTATPTSLSAAEIARRPPAEWDALIDQRERELDRLNQSRYPSWPSPTSAWMDAQTDRMEARMQQRVQQLQRSIAVQRNRYQSPWDRASSDWWDYQRSRSRLQSLQTREYMDRMMQRGLRSSPYAPGARGPWGW